MPIYCLHLVFRQIPFHPYFSAVFSIFFRCFQVIFSLFVPLRSTLTRPENSTRTPPESDNAKILHLRKQRTNTRGKEKSGNDGIKRPTPANTGAFSHKTLRRSAGANRRKFFRFLFPHAVLKRTFYKLLSLKFL